MSLRTAVTKRLGLTYPIIQAPMAGGTTTADLVAAVCEAGALGFIGAAYLAPAQIAEASREVRARTSRPFGMNLFAPAPAPAIQTIQKDASRGLERLMPFHTDMGLPAPAIPAPAADRFNEQLAAILETEASVFSFTFGVPPPNAIESV
ncbi:MAG: NAD(P)H-dependent flavin oxidoreductase, partial [Terriglobia bacterium]